MNQTNEHPAPTGPTRAAPQVVHVVAKPGGLSTALWFIVGLFVFAAVFVVHASVQPLRERADGPGGPRGELIVARHNVSGRRLRVTAP